MDKGGVLDDALNSMDRVLSVVNCTPIYGDFSIGSKQGDGSYSGALGRMIQGVQILVSVSSAGKLLPPVVSAARRFCHFRLVILTWTVYVSTYVKIVRKKLT